MSTPADGAAPPAPVLGDTLARLGALGVTVPRGVSQQGALQALVQAGLLAPAPVEQFFSLYHEQRFGSGVVDSARALAVVKELVHALAATRSHAPELVDAALAMSVPAAVRSSSSSSDLVEAPSARVPGSLSPVPSADSAALPVPQSVVPVAQGSPSEPQPLAAPDASLPWSRRTFRLRARWWIWSGLFIVWSLGLLYGGLRLALPFRDLVRPRISVARGVRPPDSSLRERLDALRVAAGRQHSAERPWWEYASFAHRAHAWGDAVLAYRHLIALHPEDPEALNSLAWLHCRAEDSWAQDPPLALTLAERAYALHPAPHITDTLAEAAFLTGDVPRALRLSEDALAGAKRKRRYYRKQLARFRAAQAAGVDGGDGGAATIKAARRPE